MKIKALLAGNSFFIKTLFEKLKKEKHIEIVADTETCYTLFKLLPLYNPDILILDLDCPDNSDIIEEIMKKYGDKVRAIAVSENSDTHLIYNFFLFGGRGYLLKTCPYEEMSGAIQSVHDGNLYLCPHISGELVTAILTIAPPFDHQILKKLTPMELNVLHVIRRGGTAKEISTVFSICTGTAQQHIKHIKKKLDVHTMNDLQRKLLFTKLDIIPHKCV